MPRGNKDNKKENLSDAPDTVKPLRPSGAAPRHGLRPALPLSNKTTKPAEGARGGQCRAAPTSGGPGRWGGGAGLMRAGATDEQGGHGGDAATNEGHDEVKTGQRRVTRTSS